MKNDTQPSKKCSVVFALERFISSFSQTQSAILTHLKYMKSHRHQKMGPERDFNEGRQRTEKQNSNRY